MHIGKKTLLTITGLLCSLGIMTAVALAVESKDEWTPANTQFKAQSKNSSFEEPKNKIKDECKSFAVAGTTPKGSGGKFSEKEAQDKNTGGSSVTPKVENCTVPLTEVNGPWTLFIHSNGTGFANQCEVGAELEDDDCITIRIPNEGAKIKAVGCTIKVNAQELTGNYNDETGQVVFTNLMVSVTSCTGAGTAIFNGEFHVKPIITDDE